MKNKKTVLIVDDNADDRSALCEMLGEKYLTVQAENGQVALEILAQEPDTVRAILLDVDMPVMDGFAFLRERAKDEVLCHIPVLVTAERVCGTGNENELDTELTALSIGASDVVGKPYNQAVLMARLANLINMYEMSTQIRKVERDSLTGLYTKESFYNKVTERLNYGENTDIVALNVVHFKLINDMYGLAEGDRFLRFLADMFSQIFVPDTGLAARISADRFVCAIPHTQTPGRMSKLLTDTLAHYEVEYRPTVRLGFYEVEDANMPVSVMCDRANLAADATAGQYDAPFAVYDATLREKLLTVAKITSLMNSALEEKQFLIYLQPKCELKTGAVVGAEALVRWVHPTNGFMNPVDFVPVFENNGFITKVDLYVLEEVCRLTAYWKKRGVQVVPISVNLSRVDLHLPRLREVLLEILARYGLQPCSIHLEITESAYMSGVEDMIDVVQNLRCAGFVIEMDDFGKGYSSLTMLSKMPVDVLKLDMAFLEEMDEEKDRACLIPFILQLADWLGFTVIAEGVETKEQAEYLCEQGCKYGQGYYFSRPLPVSEFEKKLNKQQEPVPAQEG